MTRRSVLLIGGCGYIGSYLYQKLLETGVVVEVCDAGWRGNPACIPVLSRDYRLLTSSDIARFDAILWFAGHSSVSQAIKDPYGALDNNCINLFAFARQIAPHQIFVYASTASLYSINPRRASPEESNTEIAPSTELATTLPHTNAYDISKFAFDYLAQHFLPRAFGLRMGTLAGFSPNLRPELIFHAMNLSARQEGIVHVTNAQAWRTILFIDDLWVFVSHVLHCDVKPGVYNLGSLSTRVGELAERIAEVWGVDIQDHGQTESYSFRLDCRKMKSVCGVALKGRRLEDECRSFIRLVECEESLR